MAAFSANDMRNLANSSASNDAENPHAEALTTLAEQIAGHTARPAYSPIVLAGFVRLVDFLLVATLGFVLHAFYLGRKSGFAFEYLIAIPGIAAATVVLFQGLKLYHVQALRTPAQHGLRLVGGLAGVFAAALTVVFFLKLEGTFSRVWLVIWFASALAALLMARVAFFALVRHLTLTGRLERRTVIVGGGEAGEAVLKALSSQRDTDLRILGVFDDRDDDRSPDVVGGFPKLGRVDDLVEFARHTRLDLVIFTLPISAEQRLLQMLRKLWVLPIDIRLSAHSNKLRFRPRSYSYIGTVPVLDVFDKPIADWDVVLKSAFDRVVGGLALIALSPLLLLTALAVKLDSRGPVFFRQKRYGFNNELIEIYKFRSMYVDKLDATASRLVTKGDPRVTRVGRFIRKTSIDELPQLLNVVFKGNLSLVGPRPHAVHAKAEDRDYDEVVDGYFARHRVRPGITGWAQIHGWRGETDTEEKIQRRVEHDLYYIENWSLLLDVYILALTPFALLKTENAY